MNNGCTFNMVAHRSVLGHAKLSNSAKLLYVWICSTRVDAKHKSVSWGEGDIDAGFSQKTNSYFAEKMGKGETYISQLIRELEDIGFIYIKRRNISGRNYRRIWCKGMIQSTENEMKNRPGYVYVLADGHGNFKIGRSVDWEQRIKAFGPMTLPVVVMRSNDHHFLEKYLHAKYAKKRFHGEWFTLNREDILEMEMREDVIYGGFNDPSPTYDALKFNGPIDDLEDSHG